MAGIVDKVDIHDWTSFRLATQKEIEHALKPPKGVEKYTYSRGVFSGDKIGLDKTFIYMIMQNTFGSPNGHLEEKSTWQWILYTEHGLLSVADVKSNWYISYYGANIKMSKGLKTYAERLKDHLITRARKITISKRLIKKHKIGGIVLNPYSVYNRTTKDLMNQAKKLKVSMGKKPRSESPNSIAVIMNSGLVMESLFRAAFATTFLSLEGFVNLVYTLFLRNKYHKGILKRKIMNEMLPVKILEMDVFCHSFNRSPIEQENELFSAIQHFINVRNSVLHANISGTMESHILEYEKYWLRIKDETKEKYGIPTDISGISNVHIIRANRIVTKYVISVLQSLSPDIKYPFAIVHAYMYVPYMHDKPNSTYIPLFEEDYAPKEEIERMLRKSIKLDRKYYLVKKDDFIPSFSFS